MESRTTISTMSTSRSNNRGPGITKKDVRISEKAEQIDHLEIKFTTLAGKSTLNLFALCLSLLSVLFFFLALNADFIGDRLDSIPSPNTEFPILSSQYFKINVCLSTRRFLVPA